MSEGPRINRDQAAFIVDALAKMLPGIEFVGSWRRGLETVGDLEAIAPIEPADNDKLFEALNARMSNPHVAAAGLFDPEKPFEQLPAIGEAVSGLRPGFKKAEILLAPKRLNPEMRLKFEVHRYTPENRGWVQLMRTGPSGFGMWFLQCWKKRQGIPLDDPRRQASENGHLIDVTGKVVPVRTEEEAFALCGMKFVPPYQRDTVADSISKGRSGGGW